MALGGLLVAWVWNTFVAANYEVVAIAWWQAAVVLFAIRFVIGLLKN
jgi:hypothetical protein